MKMRNILIIITWTVSLFSCTEKTIEPISKSQGKPGQVEIQNVEPTIGGAKVYYRIPENEDLMAIKAEYTLSNGKHYESSTSFYGGWLEIEGYNDTIEHEAIFYSVNRAQVLSDPTPVKFTPLKSSLYKTSKTVEITSTFGGAVFNWINLDEAPLTFEFLAQDATGAMKTTNFILSTADTAQYTLNGYPPTPAKFGVIISDRFGNSSDIIDLTVTPIFEQKLDKKLMKPFILNNDCSWAMYGMSERLMIDDDINTYGHTDWVWPAMYTIDLGKTARLSRLVFHQRLDGNRAYFEGNFKVFEIWARTDEPPKAGILSVAGGWTKIATCNVIKPSGAALGTNTDEDIMAAEAGHEFSFPLSTAPARYVRINVVSSWGGVSWFYASEFTYHGVYVE